MKHRMLIFVFLAALIGGGIYMHVARQQQTTSDPLISEFDDERDTQDIIDLMKADWDLLIYSSDYSAEFMLKHRAPSHHQPRYFGKLNLRVLRKDNELVGFTGYYKKSTYQGYLLFLAVDEKFRRQGYASRLVNYALQDLKAKGAHYVRLNTLKTNKRAQALYTKLGFTEVSRDDVMVYFEKRL